MGALPPHPRKPLKRLDPNFLRAVRGLTVDCRQAMRSKNGSRARGPCGGVGADAPTVLSFDFNHRMR